jgi:hypothetical protein
MRKILSLFVVLLLAVGLGACSGCDEEDPSNNGEEDVGVDVEEDVEEDVTEDVEDDVNDVGDDGGDVEEDGGDVEDDGGDVEDDVMDADGGTDLEPDPNASTQIETVLGGTNATIEQVAVTYTKPESGDFDPAGFFVQAEQTGPALFVEVDPTALDPDIVQGDIITFDVTETDTDGIPRATSIENVQYLASGYDVGQLAQDVTDATDLVSALDDYTVEYVEADITLSGSVGGAGDNHWALQADTNEISGNENLEFRVPGYIQDKFGFEQTCTLTVGPSPLWRFQDTAQLSAYYDSDISNADCPAPTVTGAAATAEDTVEVTFNRALDDTTVAAGEFTIADSGGAGLNVTAASVTDNVVTLTTDAQMSGTQYTVTVSDNVQDLFGAGVDQDSNTADFLGFAEPAEVVINEFNGTLSNAALGGTCDLLEIRVLSGGSLDGFQVYERESSILTFQNLTVETNDFIIVHFDEADCNASGSTNETAAVDEQPLAGHPQNFDDAYDWYTSEGTLTDTDNVLWIADNAGNVHDAVWADDTSDAANCSSASVAGSSIGAAESTVAAGEWFDTSGSTLPASLSGEDFCNNAVLGLKDTGALRAEDSIQRNGDTDNDHKGDWTITTGTWGTENSGQTAQ